LPGPHRLFLGARAVLVGAHDGAVDHRIFIVGIDREMLKDPLPDTCFGPSAEACVHLLPITEPFRQVSPRDASSIAIQHRLYKQPVVVCGYADASFTSGEQVLDPVPLVITKGISAHRSAPKADRLGIEEPVAPESAMFSHQ